MRKLALIAATSLAMGVGSADAKGLISAWNECADAGGSKTLIFDCTQGHGTVYELYDSFVLDAAINGVIEGQGIVDFTFTGSATAPPWWELATTGCNDGSLILGYLRASTCAGSSNLYCGVTQAICIGSGVTGIGYGFGMPNRNRAIIELTRPTTSPVDLPAGKHFAWKLQFLMDNPNALGPCTGCDAACTITWDNLDVIDNVGGVVHVTSGDADSSPSACANVTTCAPIPVVTKTWGRLKALYR